jgi:uncharacterized protein (DUF58 family)
VDSPRDLRASSRSSLIRRLRRWLRPPRRLRPTRAGWVFFALTFGVSFAALNTGNNLLYLMLSLMLAFLSLSGFFSEAALRGIHVTRRLPREIVVGRPARISLEITNAQLRVPSFAISVEDRVHEDREARERAAGRVFVLRVGPGQTEEGFYRFEAPQRGGVTFTGFSVATRFPFGLFRKSLTLENPARTLVYPELERVVAPLGSSAAREQGESLVVRRGSGADVGGLREFVNGDSARRIQWRASLRRGSLVVRDSERRQEAEIEVCLPTRGRRPGRRFEQAVSKAASQVEAALEAGHRVALRTDETFLAAGLGSRQRSRLLSFLALVEPDPTGEANS